MIEPKNQQAGGVFLFLDYDGNPIPMSLTAVEAIFPPRVRAVLDDQICMGEATGDGFFLKVRIDRHSQKV